MRKLAVLAFTAIAIVATLHAFITAGAALRALGALFAGIARAVDTHGVLCVADELAATALIDVARAADLMARIQANLLVRLAEKAVTTIGVRTRLIPDRASARLAIARFFGESLTPGQALAAAKYPSIRTTRTKRVIREAPGIWRAGVALIRRLSRTRSAGTEATVWAILVDAALPAAFAITALLVGRTIGLRAADSAANVLAAEIATAIQRVATGFTLDTFSEATNLSILTI